MVFETILDNREKDLIFLSKRIQSQKNTRHVKKTSNMLWVYRLCEGKKEEMTENHAVLLNAIGGFWAEA